jgi:hypothetical protein
MQDVQESRRERVVVVVQVVSSCCQALAVPVLSWSPGSTESLVAINRTVDVRWWV